jgi:hypothetical protein
MRQSTKRIRQTPRGYSLVGGRGISRRSQRISNRSRNTTLVSGSSGSPCAHPAAARAMTRVNAASISSQSNLTDGAANLASEAAIAGGCCVPSKKEPGGPFWPDVQVRGPRPRQNAKQRCRHHARLHGRLARFGECVRGFAEEQERRIGPLLPNPIEVRITGDLSHRPFDSVRLTVRISRGAHYSSAPSAACEVRPLRRSVVR